MGLVEIFIHSHDLCVDNEGVFLPGDDVRFSEPLAGLNLGLKDPVNSLDYRIMPLHSCQMGAVEDRECGAKSSLLRHLDQHHSPPPLLSLSLMVLEGLELLGCYMTRSPGRKTFLRRAAIRVLHVPQTSPAVHGYLLNIMVCS